MSWDRFTKTKEDILKILKRESSYLKKKFFVRRIGLFGSYSRGEQTEESDIDLLVEFEKPIDFFKLFKLEEYLSERLSAKVEIVTPNAIKEEIKPYIMRDVIYA
ncbi:MAG: nucleotidyltransferase family protein [Candidatus Odinarchaeota archaeon]|nr:nucleotidyltransferase family protein [Candidatus Odinarchaeota archaeon]